MCARPQAALKARDLVVERRPVAAQHVLAGDDDVDLVGAVGDRSLDLGEPRLERREARRKSRRHRGDRDAGAGKRLLRRRNEAVIDADRADGDRPVGEAERRQKLVLRAAACALAQSRATRPSVSSPYSVVRSMHWIALTSQAACHSFLTVRRVGSVAARRSTAERFTRTAATASRSKGMPGLSGWSGSALRR